MKENRQWKVSIEDIQLLCKKIGNDGEAKFLKRVSNFNQWISDFTNVATLKGRFPVNTQLRNSVTADEACICLSYNYWNQLEYFVRPVMIPNPIQKQ
jgi:hypothetical protein